MKTMHYKLAIRIGVVASFIVVTAPIVASAVSDSENTTINADIEEVISITTSGTVNLSITPAGGGSTSSSSDTVTVSTNSAAGYALTLANTDATSSLVNGGDSITAHAGTQAAATSLANNTWGYRVDGVGDFGAGPTSAENSAAGAGAYEWAGVPVSGSPNTLKTTSSEGVNDVTTVWYGVRVNQTLPSGTYSDTVTYTATTNP